MPRTFPPPPHLALNIVGKGSVRHARKAVSGLLAGATFVDWHDDAALMVSELVTNAVEECGQCRVAAWFLADFDALRVEVTDRSRNLPTPQPADSKRVGGHGLRIVESLSTRWGVTTAGDSKTVWFEMEA